MATNIGYISVLSGGQNRLNGDLMETLDWESNKYTYLAGAGAVLLILLAVMKKKKRRKAASAASTASASSAPSASRPGSLSVSYQG